MVTFIFYLIFVSASIKTCESSNILGMFAAPIFSHQIVFKTLMQELARRGHQVTVITSFAVDEDKNVTNYTEIELRDIGADVRDQLLTKYLTVIPDIFIQFTITVNFGFKTVDNIIQSDEVKRLIKNNSFDLIFIEDCTRSSMILSHLLKAPVILISSFGGSFGTFNIMGGMIHPILYPLATKKRFQYFSMWDKMIDLYDHYRLQKIFDHFEMMQDDINKKIYGHDTPTLNDLKRNVELLFLNVHSVWDSNRPVPPNVIYVGGLHQRLPKDLPKEINSSLDSAKNGVIYMSFGTTIDTVSFSTKTMNVFIKVFSKLPYDVYWKWRDEKVPELPKNIKMAKWFPQFDILRHPNVKLFITQGGLQSTDEAINAGVPLIGIPIIWDQWFNVDKYVQLKIGIQLDINTITEDKLQEAIETVIGNAEYRNNILNLRSTLMDTPQTSLDRAVWWTEYVLRRGASHLHTPSANMSWVEYYEVKLIIVLISVLIVSVFLMFLLISFVIVKLRSGKIKIN